MNLLRLSGETLHRDSELPNGSGSVLRQLPKSEEKLGWMHGHLAGWEGCQMLAYSIEKWSPRARTALGQQCALPREH